MQPGPVSVKVYDCNSIFLGEKEFLYVDPEKELIKKLVHQPSELGSFLSRYAKEREKHENGCQSSSSATQGTGSYVFLVDISIYMCTFFKKV